MQESFEEVDVAVVGVGLAGVGAACACAAAGLRTVLVERRPVLGWEATWAYRLGFSGGESAVTRAILQACQSVGGWREGRADAPVLEMALNRQVLACGVRQRNYWQVHRAAESGERLAGLACAGKSGRYELRARAFIDATNHLDVWRMTGAPVTPVNGPARAALFYNGLAEQPVERPTVVGGVWNTLLRPGIWPGELSIDYDLPQKDALSALLALPELLADLQQNFAWLKSGILTHMTLETYPLAGQTGAPERHPRLANLFRAPVGAADEALNRVGRLLDAGAAAAGELLAAWPGLHASEDGEPVWQPEPPARSVETDVLVCGGGTAGALAAVAAARRGARTVLVEAGTFLGGVGASSVHTYYWGVAGGLQDEVDRRTEALSDLFLQPGKVFGFHPVAKRLALAQLALEAGVELAFESVVSGVELAPGEAMPRVRGARVLGRDGFTDYRAGVVIDSTGDGDVAELAGAAFIQGREADGFSHPYSLVCGRIAPSGMLTYTNIDSGYVDAADAADLTRARQVALEQYAQDTLTAQNRYLFIAPTIGARSSRHIIGRQTVTLADQVEVREFEDGIAYARSHYDNHAWDYENESDEAVLWVWLMGNWSRDTGSEVPYGALLPAERDGLLVACRALAVTFDAHHQLRMQRDMQRVGEAAGLAAALCIQRGETPHTLPAARLQELLAESGALRRTEQGGRMTYHHPDWKPAQAAHLPAERWAQGLACEDPGMLLWQIYRAGPQAVPILKGAVEDENPWTRFWAAALLVLHNAPDAPALMTLIQAVRERKNIARQGYRPLQLWVAGMVLLGRAGHPAALEALGEVLADESADLHARVAALRALGRIGAPQAAGMIESALENAALPDYLPMRPDKHPGFGEDPRWRLELAAAQVLAQLGRPHPELAQYYLCDPRAHVRRYARRILDPSAD